MFGQTVAIDKISPISVGVRPQSRLDREYGAVCDAREHERRNFSSAGCWLPRGNLS